MEYLLQLMNLHLHIMIAFKNMTHIRVHSCATSGFRQKSCGYAMWVQPYRTTQTYLVLQNSCADEFLSSPSLSPGIC